jgi:hypothetical protein
MIIPCVASYEPVVVSVCVGAIAFVQRTTRSKQYSWAGGLVAIAMVVSRVSLTFKIFLVTGFTCIAAYITLLAGLPPRLAPAH